MIRILVSSCLLGQPVRYDGKAGSCDSDILSTWNNEGRLLSFCPEVSAGLSTPRPAAEIVGGDGKAVLEGLARVNNKNGRDVTASFIDGAKKAVQAAQLQTVRIAILKENSPSCGSTTIHDGFFNGVKQPGRGVTAELMVQNGIRVFNEFQIIDAQKYLQAII